MNLPGPCEDGFLPKSAQPPVSVPLGFGGIQSRRPGKLFARCR